MAIRGRALAAVQLLLLGAGIAAVIERSARRAQLGLEGSIEGREAWAPNYRHIWYSHDAAFVSGGRWGDQLCQFGGQLEAQRDNWQALCRLDGDLDGRTAGEELGDPCCLWTPAAAGESFSLARRHEYRRWGLTHPAKPDDLLRPRSEAEPADCGAYDPARYAAQFEAFYYGNAAEAEEPTPLVPAKVASLAVLVALLGHWFWRRDLAADVCPWLLPSKARLSPRVSLAVCVAAFFYMDLTSGIVHLILDYAPPWLPGIGPLARGFQFHHADPTAIVRISWYAYVSHVHLLCPLVAALVLLGDASRVQRLFWFWGAVFVHLFQTTHRWAHFPPAVLPWPVRGLQACGLLLSHERHMSHHEDLERQLTILSGHTDAILDAASRIVPPWRYDLWLILGVCWFLLPVMLDLRFRGLYETLDEGSRSTHKATKDECASPAEATNRSRRR